MNNIEIGYAFILLVGVFASSLSQVMLKKSALKNYNSRIKEYLNPLVLFAYIIFLSTTVLSIIAYKGIPISMGPVLEATSYIYVTIWGKVIFNEKFNTRKIIALMMIIAGIVVSFLSS